MARPKKNALPETPWPSRAERITPLDKPIEIYYHGPHSGYGVRIDLPGGDRVDLDFYDPQRLAQSATEAVLRHQRRRDLKSPGKLTLDFTVQDRKTGFGVKPEDVKVSARLRVTAFASAVKVETIDALPAS